MSHPRLLLAGNDAGALKELDRILAGAGYKVLRCTPGQLGEAALVKGPDLIILVDDLAQKEHLLARLKADPGTRHIPVLAALTPFTESAAAQALAQGADEFLAWPCEPKEVLARVAVLLKLQQDRQLLLASRQEFTRLFTDNPQPLIYCDRQGAGCRLNPALIRLLGLPEQRGEAAPLTAGDLFMSEEDRQRFARLLAKPEALGPVKVNLKNRSGEPVTVLLTDLAPARDRDQVGFQVQPVGEASPLKRALRGLVENFLPAARDYLAILSMTPLLGGRYEKVKKLGQGSFGEVWLVLDTESLGPERHYVAKIPFSRKANPKFRKEAAICQKLTPHPGIVRLIDAFEDDGRYILIQEYVAGPTLDEMLGEELPPEVVESIILQLIEVAAHAHRHRVMHRDIKPNNIIIQPDGTLKLLDYGAAKILKEEDISATMVGSRPFMAPEQIMGESERKSDLWAIGVIMYLLYTGELPFYSDNEKFLIDLILEQEPAPPRELNPELPPALENIILKCLRKNVTERYANAGALKADIRRHFPRFGAKRGG